MVEKERENQRGSTVKVLRERELWDMTRKWKREELQGRRRSSRKQRYRKSTRLWVLEVTVKWKYRLYEVDRRVWRDVEIQNLGYTASCGPGGREMRRVMQVREKEELEEAELSMEGRTVR